MHQAHLRTQCDHTIRVLWTTYSVVSIFYMLCTHIWYTKNAASVHLKVEAASYVVHLYAVAALSLSQELRCHSTKFDWSLRVLGGAWCGGTAGAAVPWCGRRCAALLGPSWSSCPLGEISVPF